MSSFNHECKQSEDGYIISWSDYLYKRDHVKKSRRTHKQRVDEEAAKKFCRNWGITFPQEG